MSLLVVEDLAVSYSGALALHSVSLKLEPASITVLLGGNGAGKSTLMRAIIGMGSIRSGEVRFQDHVITRASRSRLRKRSVSPWTVAKLGISLVPEGRGLFADQSVEANLLLGAFRRWWGNRAAVREDLERVYADFPVLSERRNQPAGTLSGGEQQLVAVARAIMARPKLVLIDEPTLGLDPRNSAAVYEAVRLLQERGLSILVAEESAARAFKIAQYCYVLEGGRKVLEGTPESLRNNDALQQYYFGLTRPGEPA